MTRWSYQSAFKVLCLALSLAAAYAFAWMTIGTYFPWYDDEGFMLMTLRQYIGGLPLYDKMYTEYGPFYYVFQSALFRSAGWSVTHDHIRWLTLMLWLGVAAGWAVCVWAWSRSIFWGTTALLATMVVLRELNREPGNTHAPILVLYGLAFMAASAYKRVPGPIVFAVIGAVAAALALTKINVGIFMCAALAAVFTSCLPPDRVSRALAVIVRAGCIALPAVLMHRHLREPSAAVQCLVYMFGIWATLYVLKRNARPELAWSAVVWGAVGFSAIALWTVTAIHLHGTSFSGVLNGVVLYPLQYSRGIPFQSLNQTRTLIAALAGACMLFYARQRLPQRVYATMQTTAAAAVIVLTVISPPLGTSIAPFVIFMFLPGPGGTPMTSTEGLPMFLVVVAASFAVLMGYPVTGTQLAVAAAIVLLAAFGALLHGLRDLGHNAALPGRRFAFREPVICGVILVAVLCIGVQTLKARPAIEASDQHLPNSQLIQLSAEDYAVFSEITARISSHCDTLVTIPGMNSFYIWSGLPHPNGFVVSATMVLFDAPTQERLRRDFLSSKRPCVIFNPGLILWGEGFRQPRLDEPFIDLVKNGLVPVYSRNGYEIRVPSAQVPAWR